MLGSLRDHLILVNFRFPTISSKQLMFSFEAVSCVKKRYGHQGKEIERTFHALLHHLIPLQN